MRPHKQAGFSLLELLVALFVVVIITSLVTLAVNSGGQAIELEEKARSLADISGYAMDEAQMRAVDMGLLIERLDEGGDTRYRYSWLERMPLGWRIPVIDQDIFGKQQFPEGVELELELEGTPVELLSGVELASIESSPNGKGVELTPQVIFYSSGEVTTGSIEVRQVSADEVLWRIEWDLLGRFTLLRRGEVHDE